MRRARKLRGQSELIIGEILASMRDRGLRQTRSRRKNLPSLTTLGLQFWATAMRWERRARERDRTPGTGSRKGRVGGVTVLFGRRRYRRIDQRHILNVLGRELIYTGRDVKLVQ